MIGGEARRRQQVGLEPNVEPLVDRSQAIDELCFDRGGDHDGDLTHVVVSIVSGGPRRG